MIRTAIKTLAAAMLLLMPLAASAHVVVTPSQANVGQELTFSISVPNERKAAVTSVKIEIPKGVAEVEPTAIPGWTATVDGSDDDITAITWAQGQIPVGQRLDFSFSAQVPGSATELDWKAYQTYDDGTIVHWDQKPAGSDDADGNAGPYSVTQVVAPKATSHNDALMIALNFIPAVLIILIAFFYARRRRI